MYRVDFRTFISCQSFRVFTPSPGFGPQHGGYKTMTDEMQVGLEKRITVINTLKQELIRRLNLPYTPEDLHEDISLLGAGLGLDSLDALEIVLCVENSFGIKIPDESTSVLRSINTIVDFVLVQQAQKTGAA
jgi:acyl carrier protein